MTILTSMTSVDFVNKTLDNNVTITASSSITIISAMPAWIRILTLICMIVIDISVFFGNLLVICAFFRTRRLQTVTNYFIASLAFADALVAIFVLPLSIYYYQHDRSWKLGLILCDLWVSSDVLLCTSSILNLTCISVDRYMAITRPLTYTAYRSKFLARIMILLVWITSIVITCPPIFGWRDSNRQHTVEHEHRCELNTARGYVVYSALGSFYIPAVTMIFVYIRIFMVVYDRENLMQKFHTNTNTNTNTTSNNNHNINSIIQTSLKTNQNGLINAKNISNGMNDMNNQDLNKRSKKSSCCCECFQKQSEQNKSIISHQTSLSPFNNNCLSTEQKPNGSLIYRFTTNNNNNCSKKQDCLNLTSNTPPLTSKIATRGTLFCRPCTISTRKITSLSTENNYRRRKFISRIGAQYQFRSGDSPCYELKKFQNSLPSLIKCRSHSFDRSSIRSKRDLNLESNQNRQFKTSTFYSSTIFNDKSQSEIHDALLLNKENDGCPIEHLHKITQSLNELTHDKTQVISNEQTKLQEIKYPKRLSKCSSLIEQNLTNNSNKSNGLEYRCVPEQTRINRRTKPTRLTKVPLVQKSIENLAQQNRMTLHNNSSIKSNHSATSMRRKNNTDINSSKRSCCSCLRATNSLQENKNKKNNYCTPNQSLTYDDDYDDDYDEKLSSNDTNNRTTMMMTSNASLRALENQTHNNLLSSHRHYQSPSGNTQNPSNDVHRRERIRFMKEQKTAKTLAVVVGGFILFWLPFFIMYVIPPEIYSFNPQTATLITWLGYFNSVINPFIYAYCSKQFRMAFWNITFGMCIKRSNALNPVSVKNRQITRHHTNG